MGIHQEFAAISWTRCRSEMVADIHGVATLFGFLEIVNIALQRKLLNLPSWTLVLLLCVVVLYTVIAAAREKFDDISEEANADPGMAEALKTQAEASKESATAYKSGQGTIDGLRADLKAATDKLSEQMEENAKLREEVARLKSRDDG